MRPKTRQPKLIGEWVELKFMVECAEHGLAVSKPYGDSARFDFIVGNSPPLRRVQVRGTAAWTKGNSYVCRIVHGPGSGTPYRPRDIDFFALYAIPRDTWYIIPLEAIHPLREQICLFPHRKVSRGRYERFRNAWHLLAGKNVSVLMSL